MAKPYQLHIWQAAPLRRWEFPFKRNAALIQSALYINHYSEGQTNPALKNVALYGHFIGKVANKVMIWSLYTDKKLNLIFFICKEIQTGTVAKPYMTNGLLKYD